MITDNWQKRLITRVAYLYYIKKDNQKTIAKKIGVDRTTVSRMLKRAERAGVISFQINGFDTRLFELENVIKNKYHLKTVLLAPNFTKENDQERNRNISNLALHYLKHILTVDDIVGLSWGRALEMMADGVSNLSDVDATFVPLAGGPSKQNSKYHVNGIVYDLARKFKGKSKFIDAAALQANSFRANQIRQTAAYRGLQKCWSKMRIALVGIGGPLNEKSSWRDLLTPQDISHLKAEKIVGDCCCHFFNEKGLVVDKDIEERLIACPLQLLQIVPYSIGLAYSLKKVKAIKALLKRNLLNVLITDEETALALK